MVVEPGDTLFIDVSQMATKQQCEYIEQALSEKMPGVHIVAMQGIGNSFVYKPNNAATKG